MIFEISHDSGVTAASGFRAAGIAAGIKASGNRDLALIVNDGPLDVTAGLLTSNKIKAAPVVWTQGILEGGSIKAVLLNSGGANACTGPAGSQDARQCAYDVAEVLSADGTKITPQQVALCSTGIIGDRLPMTPIKAGIQDLPHSLGTDESAGVAASEAIMTTDTVAKRAEVKSKSGWVLGGMTKGSGMIAPNLATMLVVLTTDAVVDSEVLDVALQAAGEQTFNRFDVDGCTSTNDTVLLMGSGASGITADPVEFGHAVLAVCDDLVNQMMDDAEGSTKRVRITVTGAATEGEALIAARIIARDPLVKTALFGSDPNWGRVLAAVGVAPVAMNPDRICVFFNSAPVCVDGMGTPGARDVDLSGLDILIEVDLAAGDFEATIRTTDLSHDYVEINSAYSS